MKESEDISARAEERYPDVAGRNLLFQQELKNRRLAFIEGYKACLAAQSQRVEESKWIDDTRVPESNIIKQQAMELDEKDFDQW